MYKLWSGAQLIEQMLLWTLRWARHDLLLNAPMTECAS